MIQKKEEKDGGDKKEARVLRKQRPSNRERRKQLKKEAEKKEAELKGASKEEEEKAKGEGEERKRKRKTGPGVCDVALTTIVIARSGTGTPTPRTTSCTCFSVPHREKNAQNHLGTDLHNQPHKHRQPFQKSGFLFAYALGSCKHRRQRTLKGRK